MRDLSFEQDTYLSATVGPQSVDAMLSVSSHEGKHVETVAAPSYYSFRFGMVLDDFGVDQGWTNQSTFTRHIGDVDGDGQVDIVGIGYGGVLVSIFDRNNGWPHPELVASSSNPKSDFGVTQLADVNGDGRADLISFKAAGTSVSYGQANGTFDVSQIGQHITALSNFGDQQGWQSQDRTPRLVADVNGDGKGDVIGFGAAGVWVSLATGGAGSNAFQAAKLGIADFGVEQGWTSDQIYHRALADVNGDGRADIVGFGDEGVVVSLSNGDGTFAPMKFAIDDFGADQGWSTQDAFPRIFGDLNKDGRADIVGFGADKIYVAYGQSDGTFSGMHEEYRGEFTGPQGWTSENMFPRFILPDGSLFGFGYDGIYALSNLYGQPLPG